MSHNLYEILTASVKNKDKTFLITEDKNIVTYQDIDILSARIADRLSKLGIAKGDRLVAQVSKSIEALALYLGCLRSGVIFVPLNPAFTLNELQYYLENAEPKIVICSPDACAKITTLAAKIGINIVRTLEVADANSLIPSQDIEPENLHFPPVEVAKNDIAVMIYTSGTTGKPKGAMLSHHNLAVNGTALKNCWDFSDNDVLLHSLPIFHVHGLFFATHCVMLSGASMLFLPKFSVDTVLKFLPQATVMMGVPTYYTRLLADSRFQKAACSQMRLFISGSAPLREETFQAFKHRTGLEILERYGMSETGVNTSNPLQGERRLGTVGLPLGKSELRIVDNNNLSLSPEQVGNVQVKGENVFAGYWRMPAKTKAEFTNDGFFKTGDLGKLSVDGYVSLVGRAKDLIISGGMNVYPKEVEVCLNEIAGVVESAVIGLPHTDFGEAVTAMIVSDNLEMSDREIKAYLQEKLANYKIPKQFLSIDSLPRNAMGKVQKNILRQKYQDLYKS
ncbi:MAG: AMP-binding protein [Xenococcaceae cyanobacterium]